MSGLRVLHDIARHATAATTTTTTTTPQEAAHHRWTKPPLPPSLVTILRPSTHTISMYSTFIIIIIIISSSHLLVLLPTCAQMVIGENGQQEHHEEAERSMHPSLFVDTKYWLRNTEFGHLPNWLDGRKPCSLVERVAIEEEGVVVSMGDAMDSIGVSTGAGKLESDIREFVLAQDGVVVLEEDTLATDPPDTTFLQFLNNSGNCFDYSASLLPEEDLHQEHWFKFAPHPDELSWFNPNNWAASLAEYDSIVAQLIPESHQVPCGEDVVVFGSRQRSSWPTFEANERARVLAFKVNFRASEATRNSSSSQPLRTSPLRVSKLKIGEKSYTQAEFDQLIRLYGNNLFEFQDELSVFVDEGSRGLGTESTNPDGRPQTVLTIDESSIQDGATVGNYEYCLDEAGCECGNEHPSRMEIICSFNEPLEPRDMPCLDPLRSAGYCNKICATLVTINMDPTKFSERFLASLLNDVMSGSRTNKPANYFSNNIFAGSRRVNHNKYEITIRLLPVDNDDSPGIPGRDIEFAEFVKQILEKPATASFYGIKAVSVKSSTQWRKNNRKSIFALTLLVAIPLAMTLFAKYDDHITESIVHLMTSGRAPLRQDLARGGPLSMVSNESLIADDDESISGIKSNRNTACSADNLAMVDLETTSITGSTHNLLDMSNR